MRVFLGGHTFGCTQSRMGNTALTCNTNTSSSLYYLKPCHIWMIWSMVIRSPFLQGLTQSLNINSSWLHCKIEYLIKLFLSPTISKSNHFNAILLQVYTNSSWAHCKIEYLIKQMRLTKTMHKIMLLFFLSSLDPLQTQTQSCDLKYVRPRQRPAQIGRESLHLQLFLRLERRKTCKFNFSAINSCGKDAIEALPKYKQQLICTILNYEHLKVSRLDQVKDILSLICLEERLKHGPQYQNYLKSPIGLLFYCIHIFKKLQIKCMNETYPDHSGDSMY